MIGLKYLYAMLAGAFSGQPARNTRGRRPTGSELRNPADPAQARRIEAAAAKRTRRAEKLSRNMLESDSRNAAHDSNSTDPFYIAK